MDKTMDELADQLHPTRSVRRRGKVATINPDLTGKNRVMSGQASESVASAVGRSNNAVVAKMRREQK